MISLIEYFNLNFAFIVFSSYLLGSIPFGLLLTRLAGLDDIRSIGSGNIGATNVLRSGKKGLAAATLLLDGGKGWLAVYLVGSYWDIPDGFDAGLIAGFATVIGHVFPVYLKFKGGKGVATTLGVFLGTDLLTGVVACIIWIIAALIFRFSSLAALLALLAVPVYAYSINYFSLMITATALACLSAFCHRANIKRLLSGKETKIGN